MTSVIDDMQDLLAFPESSRVWIYQGDSKVTPEIVGKVNEAIQRFSVEWTSHNRELSATGGLLHDRFVVLVVNEDIAGVSGCSIDSSVKFLRHLGEQTGVDFMDRLNFAYIDGEEVKAVHKDELPGLYASGAINDSTLFFDNLVKSKRDFVSSWVKPLGDSWMKRFV